MFAAARQWLTRVMLHRIYEDWLLARLCAYVERDTAHIIVVSAATCMALASVRLVLSLFYRLTLRVADDCLRLVYLAVLMLVVTALAPSLLALVTVVDDGIESPPPSPWFGKS